MKKSDFEFLGDGDPGLAIVIKFSLYFQKLFEVDVHYC